MAETDDMPAGVGQASASEDAWRMIMTRRHEAPPLRFKGKAVYRQSGAVFGIAISIDLWTRRSGGYVAAVDVDGRETSAKLGSIQDAIQWLEGLCSPDAPFWGSADPQATAQLCASGAMRQRAVRILAGDALNQWDLLADSEAA